jgi:hypothetical protein
LFSPPGRSALKFLQAGCFSKSVPASTAPLRGLARTILYSLAAVAMLPKLLPGPRRQLHPLRQHARGSIHPAPYSGDLLRLCPAGFITVRRFRMRPAGSAPRCTPALDASLMARHPSCCWAAPHSGHRLHITPVPVDSPRTPACTPPARPNPSQGLAPLAAPVRAPPARPCPRQGLVQPAVTAFTSVLDRAQPRPAPCAPAARSSSTSSSPPLWPRLAHLRAPWLSFGHTSALLQDHAQA